MNSIVIPIYKSKPDRYEEASFVQCLRVLSNYPISIVTHNALNIDYYTQKLDEYNVSYHIEYFDAKYFSNITGYNFLMLSKDFYKRFVDYEYILIYQLDCFVFEDKLSYWTSKKFDYIGSPWFSHYMDYSKETPFWYNGNGGFSLRRVQTFLDVLEWKYPLKKAASVKYYLKELNLPSVQYYKSYLLQILGFHNNIKYFLKDQGYDPRYILEAIQDNIKRSNEDVIWSNSFKYTWIKINTPDFLEGLGFSFERSPRYLFKQNGNQLPFGCHAWAKYDLAFWKEHIESFGYVI